MRAEREPVRLDAILSALDDGRRRTIVRLLSRTDGSTVALGALVDKTIEYDRRDGTELKIENRERVRTTLYHLHLPKLDAADIINWNRENRSVAGGSQFEAAETLLTALPDHLNQPVDTVSGDD